MPIQFADFSAADDPMQAPQYQGQQGPPGGRPPGAAPPGMPQPYGPPIHQQAPYAPEPPKTNYLLWGLGLAVAAGGIWWINKQDEEFEKKQMAQNAVEEPEPDVEVEPEDPEE